MLSIRRTRLIEVLYNLRVTVNGSIYVDVPVTLINFLSIDPPPMPRDGPRLLAPESTTVRASTPNTGIDTHPNAAADLLHMASMETMKSLNPARASSTTLHLDALLLAGRARAEAEGRGTESAKVRPTSMMSEYTVEPLSQSVEPTPKVHMGPTRFKSFLSVRSDETGVTGETGGLSSEGHGDEGEQEEGEQDKQLVAARRARGRQRSLAVINRAMQQAREAEDEEAKLAEAAQQTQSEVEEIIMSPMEEEYRPLETPAEISMPIVASPAVPPTDHLIDSMTPTLGVDQIEDTGTPQWSDNDKRDEAEQEPVERLWKDTGDVDVVGVDEIELGDQTVLDELVSQHSEHEGYAHSQLFGEYGGYDYAEEYEDQEDNDTTPVKTPTTRPTDWVETSPSRRKSLPRQLPLLNINPRLSMGGFETLADTEATVGANRVFNDSYGYSAKSENGSEAGQVVQAVKRNVSVKHPPRLVALPTAEASLAVGPAAVSPATESKAHLSPTPTDRSCGPLDTDGIATNLGDADAVDISLTENTQSASLSSREASASRRVSSFGSLAPGMRRELSNPSVSSPQRSTTDLDYAAKSASEDDLTAGLRKQSSFSLAPPISPLGVNMSVAPKSPVSPGTRPLGMATGQKQLPSVPRPSDVPTAKSPLTAASNVRHAVWLSAVSPTPSDDDDRDPPGLAPSIASDSASSEGHLESPPITSSPVNDPAALPTKGTSSFAYSGLKYAAVSHNWAHGPHNLSTEVNYLQTDPHPTIHRRGSNRLGPVTSRASSDDNHSISTHETSASILPSVRTKIAQLESRDEALRKFSIASITGSQPPPPLPAATPRHDPSSPRYATSSPKYAPSSPRYPPSSPRYTHTSPAKSPSGRKSYTTALAPRAPRQAPLEYTLDGQLGGTTYIRPRVYRETKVDLDGPLDPFGLGLNRKTNSASTNASATGFDSALGGKKGLGSHLSPRMRELPPVPTAERLAEETDDSEGLL
jgi:hypothetical protein